MFELEKSENYQKLYDSFLNFIRKNLELNKYVLKIDYYRYFNPKVEEFLNEHSLSEPILLGFLDELNLNSFIKCDENIVTNERISGRNTTGGSEIKKNYFVTFKVFLNNINDKTIFFAREFNNKETKKIYTKIKNKLEQELNFNLVMLEDDKAADNIHSRIKNEIKYCRYFIADLAYKDDPKGSGFINSNVMLEIGMAMELYV